MAHRQFVAQALSQWPTTTAISLRMFRIYIGPSPLVGSAANASKMPVVCRTYSTSTLETPPHLLNSPKSAKSQLLSAHTPGSPGPQKATPSSAELLLSSKPWKKKKPTPKLVVYHNPESAASVKLLNLLQSAQNAYPRSKRRTGPPLDFKVEILARLPTAEELQDMYSLLNESSWTVFRARNTTSNYRHHPTSARSLLDLINLERQEETAKARQKTHKDAVVAVTPATDHTEPTTAELPTEELPVLDIDHPLFGTQTFPWPVLVCWDAKNVIVGLRLKNVERLLRDFANDRDDIVVKTEEQIKEDAEKARQANWTYPEKEEPPEEDDTLKWFNESSQKPRRKLSW